MIIFGQWYHPAPPACLFTNSSHPWVCLFVEDFIVAWKHHWRLVIVIHEDIHCWTMRFTLGLHWSIFILNKGLCYGVCFLLFWEVLISPPLKTRTSSSGIGGWEEALFTSILEWAGLQGQGALLPPMQGTLPILKACGLAWSGGEGGCMLAALPHCMPGTPLSFIFFLLVLLKENTMGFLL